jgi:glucose/arabinose dehydrogenase
MATLIVGDDGSNTLPGTAGADLIYGYDPTNGPQNQASAITATRVATGLTLPTFAGAPPGDTSRLFIVEKTGQIKILDLASGQVLATPFLDLSGQISDSGERGLLGLAFDPNFATNGFIYIDVSVPPVGNTEIRRYHVDPLNPNVVEAGSGTLLLTIPQFEQSNHKGGWLGFGPDGYLYITVGDGGGGFDQLHSGQDINSLRGKILRIDVHNGDDFPADPGRNYHIPADNPRRTEPTKSLRMACATRGGRASTAASATFTSAMSARIGLRKSTSARRASITVGTPTRVQTPY